MTIADRFWKRFASRAVVAVAALSIAGTTNAQSAPQNRAIVEASFEAWQAGTGNPFDLLADDARWTIEGHSAASFRRDAVLSNFTESDSATPFDLIAGDEWIQAVSNRAAQFQCAVPGLIERKEVSRTKAHLSRLAAERIAELPSLSAAGRYNEPEMRPSPSFPGFAFATLVSVSFIGWASTYTL